MIMKKTLILITFLMLLIFVVKAQSTVTGRVIGNDNESLPGVTVLEKGTSNGSITDGDGNYQITVSQGAILVFRFSGFEPKEVSVGTQTTINVSLEQDIQFLQEVVVTAFGIDREKSSLGYSITQVNGGKFTESRAVNLGTALTGKVAGVSVNIPSTGVAGQSRVVIRGGSSLSGDDQPLYVVNGVPMDNTNQGAAGLWGGSDQGNGLSSLNPDDIENITVLKGNSAAALYGSRAANGVILITTKSGQAGGEGVGISFNSNYTFDIPINLTDFQTQYGYGGNGEKPLTQEGALAGGGQSWGARLDGSDVIQFDGVSRPYADLGEDITDFYEVGKTFTNTLAFSGGNNDVTYRFSVSNLNNSDLVPNSGYDRQTYATNVSGKFGKFTAKISGQYSYEETKNRPRVSDSPGNANFTAWLKPPSISFNTLRGSEDKPGAKQDGTELRSQGNKFAQNPYWAAFVYGQDDVRNRILGNTSLRYDVLDGLYIQGRVGTDFQNRDRKETEPYGTAFKPLGSFNTRNRKVQETNLDLLIGYNKTFGEFRFDVLLGTNRMRRSSEEIRIGGNNLTIPFFSSVRNVSPQTYEYNFSEFGIDSFFGQATFSYGNYLFLNLLGRQDRFSNLNPDDNSIFYPSVGVSFVLSEAIQLPSVITFAKVRTSYAQSGPDIVNSVPFASLSQTFKLEGTQHEGASLAEINGNRVSNPGLKPYLSSEIELGLDLGFLDNRISIDFTYYDRKTEDEILDLNVSRTSGFTDTKINFAELSNKGVELLINARPVQTKNFTWDVSFNMAHNISEAINLGVDAEGNPVKIINQDESRIRSGERVSHMLGERLGLITGFKHMRIDGQLVYDENGFPVKSTEREILGQGRHPFTGGISNTFSYKNFDLSFLIDMRAGGSVFSGTNNLLYRFGLHQETLEGRESGLKVSGVDKEGEPLEVTVPVEELGTGYYNRLNDIPEYFIYKAHFGKLREISLGYQIPSSLLSNLFIESAKFSIVGRNLAILWSGDIPNVDPESGYTASNKAQGLEFFAVPTTRSIGFNLNVTF